MQDWNVVVSVRDRHYQKSRRLLEEYGLVSQTAFFNVLLLKVDSIETFLRRLQARYEAGTELRECLGHVVPVTTTFTFHSPAEFESGARQALLPWVPALAGKTFHVRMHRRGFKDRISSQEEERRLDRFLLERLADTGASARIDFDDPDEIIAVETVAQWAGLSFWMREDLLRYPFLRLD
jgi:adenylyl- and sulfurtransferase ThiI